MEISSSPLEWDEVEDRDLLAQFLRTRTGSRLLPKLAESRPSLLPGGDTNSILIRSGEVRGIEIVIQTLLGLATPTKKQEPESPVDLAYPPLTDDKSWKDGQALSINPKPA